jgi:hypothetical protein
MTLPRMSSAKSESLMQKAWESRKEAPGVVYIGDKATDYIKIRVYQPRPSIKNSTEDRRSVMANRESRDHSRLLTSPGMMTFATEARKKNLLSNLDRQVEWR